MSIKTKQLLLALSLTVLSIKVNAVIIGDKDWLQLTATVDFSWNQWDAIFATTTGQCNVAVCQLGNVDLTGYSVQA